MPLENLYYSTHTIETGILSTITEATKQKYLDFFKELPGNNTANIFMRVNCDVMRDAGIFKNDIIIADRLLEPTNGKIIIAKLGEDLLIRRFEKSNRRISLLADSQKLSSIIIDANCEEFAIMGVVTYVIHKL